VPEHPSFAEQMIKLFEYLKGSKFLPDWCDIPNTSHTRHKMCGRGDQITPVEFSEEEKKKIVKGVEKYVSSLLKIVGSKKKLVSHIEKK
jgi:hypothetical protein